MENPPIASRSIVAGTATSNAVSPFSVLSKTDSEGRPWLTSFAVIGDFGNVAERKSNLATERVPTNYVGEAIRQMGPDFIIALGDDNYSEGKQEWKDFNVGKNYSPYIYPYHLMNTNKNDAGARDIASSTYLASQVPHKSWNRFFPAPGNHDVGMSGGKGSMESSGRRDWSYDAYYKDSLDLSRRQGALIPIAAAYVKPGDKLYFDYSYRTPLIHPGTWFNKPEGAMDPSEYDYIVKPINSNGDPLKDLANIFMIDRNNAAYKSKNTGYAGWIKSNPSATMDPQSEFIMAEAKRRQKEVSWQIFASHYQTYSSESNMASMQLPFFKSGFNLALGAHVHNYERIKAADSAGVQGDFIVNGVGGYNTSYSGNDLVDEVFAPIGTVSGYQAGSTGKWGYGWIDMNKDELMYRQFTVEFTPVKNPWPIGIAVDSYTGKEPITGVKITEVDRLVLKKKPSSQLSFDGGPFLSSTEAPLSAVSTSNNFNLHPLVQPGPLVATRV